MSMARALCILILPTLLLACGCGPDKLTAENFDQIQKGMTKSEVRSLLGEPELVNFSTMPGGREEQWYYGEGKRTAAIAFLGDKVVHVGSTGLHHKPSE